MTNFKDLFPENLYHSYIVEGDPEITSRELLEYLKSDGYVDKKSSDIFCQTYDAFTISDSSKIKEWHVERGVTDGKRICIIGTKFINHDAERTLLKIIEEPAIDTHFFIVVPNSQVLLDTIISRTHIVKVNEREGKLENNNFIDFLKNSPEKRIDIISKIIDEHKNDEGSGSFRYTAIEFINVVENIIYKNWKKDLKNRDLVFSLEELAKAREYLSVPGASVKMILEHLSLVL